MTESSAPERASDGAARGGDREPALRQLVAEQLARSSLAEAMHTARDLLASAPGRRSCRYLSERIASLPKLEPGARRIALLSSFSIEFLHDALVATAFAAGTRLEVYQPAFATFRQEILDPSSRLYAEQPDFVVLAVEAEDWSTGPFGEFFALRDDDQAAAVARFDDELMALLSTFRGRSAAPLLVHNLALPAWRKLGILDAKSAHGQAALIGRLNDALTRVARSVADVHVVDYAGLVNRHGALNWYDDRMRLYARAPIAGAMQHRLAEEYVKFVRALVGGARKCLVVDLDNTLWGGVVGEDGVDGIRLGASYPGSAYLRFQQLVQDLGRRGVILAIASKNNPADVDEVFARHPSMLLRKEDFAAVEVGWSAKSESLRRIAARLSIGLEHVVFVDDNPVECEEIRRALPQVQVIALPPQPERYVAELEREGLFDTLAISDEDRRRGDLYRQRAAAESVRAGAGSLEDFYRDLAMEIIVAPIGPVTLPRAAQLTQKTNQFNVTTRRYTESEIAERLRDDSWTGFTVAVRDRFGDNGVVGVALGRDTGRALEIDTLLLSCRVIGRTVETAMLAQLCDDAAARGLVALEGRFLPTAKNAPARDVFERHGFARDGGRDGGENWRLDLSTRRVHWPVWFVRATEGAAA
jgi:FkbH-like protein